MSSERLHFAMPRPVPPGRFRRVPPVLFLAVVAGVELALAWTAGVAAFALPAGLAQMLAGMVAAVAALALVSYGCKLARRPGVLAEELTVLPGRAGVAAAVLVLYALAALAGEIGGQWAGRALLVAGLILHAVVLAAMARTLAVGPSERRRVSPDWHLTLAGLAVAARGAALLGWPVAAAVMASVAGVAALGIWAASLRQLASAGVPGPLRPLLALHLVPAAVLAVVALELGATAAGQALAWIALAGTLVMVAGCRWMLGERFSGFWGAPALALATTAGAWTALWSAQPTEPHRLIGGVVLVAATLAVIPVLALVLKDWANGRLSARSNAAIA